jgi:hypothetical protein
MMKRALPAFLLAIAVVVAAPHAHANSDEVQFGSDIHIASGQTAHDAVCFFCSVRADGKVNGDIVVFFGDVELNGEAHHDVVNFFGKTTAADNASVGGDMVNFFGSVRLGENVTVGKDLVAFFGSLDAPSSVSVGGDRVVQPAWVIALPPLVFILVILVIVYELRSYRRRQFLGGYPGPPRQ